MKSIQALREQRQALAKQARAQIDAKGDARWTAEDQAAFDALETQITDIDNQIDSMQRLLNLEAEKQFSDIENGDPKALKKNQRMALFDKMLRQGPAALSAEEHQFIRNTMSTGTGNQGGTLCSQISRQRSLKP